MSHLPATPLTGPETLRELGEGWLRFRDPGQSSDLTSINYVNKPETLSLLVETRLRSAASVTVRYK